jgi:hypothetical protein
VTPNLSEFYLSLRADDSVSRNGGLWVLTIIGYLIGPKTSGKELEEVQL